MFRDFIFILLVLFFPCIKTNPIICNGSHVIDPPNDINSAWYYPNGWKETDTPPTFAANQNCTWKVIVPKGLFASLTITANTNKTLISVIDSIGNRDWVPGTTDQEPYFLLDPQFSVSLESYAEGTFGMKVFWTKIGVFNPSSEPVLPNTVPIVKSSGDCDKGLLIYSNTNVSLVAIRPPSTDIKEMNKQLRNTVVFDGRTMEDKLIGNLWQIYEMGNHVVSTGKYFTLYSFMPSVKTDTYALIQDYENVKQFSTYQGVSCFNDLLCPVIIDARNGQGAAVRMYDSSYFLEEVNLADDSKLTVYTGTIDPSHQLVQYSNIKNLTSAQKFNGLFTTYAVDKAIGIIYLSTENLDSTWSSIFDGRNGILASKNYGVDSSDQNIQEIFTGSFTDIYNILLNLISFGLTDVASLTVTVSSGENVVFDQKYTSKQLPPKTILAKGNKLSINYVTNGSNTTGAYMIFDFDLESSTATTLPTTTNSVNSTQFTPETTTKKSSETSTMLSFLIYSVFITLY